MRTSSLLLSALLTVTSWAGVSGTRPAAALEAPSTAVSTAPAPGGVAGTTSVYTIQYGGLSRSYRLFVPSSLPTGPRPLMLGLHSFTKDAAYFESSTGMDAGAARLGALAAYPDGLDNSWNAGTCCGTSSASGTDDVGFLAAVIADVSLHQVVDSRRVAVAGFSNGAMMAFRFACERSDLVDLIEVFGGAYVAPACAFRRPVTLLQVHGLLDTTVPFLGGLNASLSPVPFPNAKGPVTGVAALDGCKGSTSAPFNGSALATLWQASGCPTGTYVWLITSTTLGHFWTTGSTAVGQYGVDMTGTAWGFTQGIWSTRGTAVAL